MENRSLCSQTNSTPWIIDKECVQLTAGGIKGVDGEYVQSTAEGIEGKDRGHNDWVRKGPLVSRVLVKLRSSLRTMKERIRRKGSPSDEDDEVVVPLSLGTPPKHRAVPSYYFECNNHNGFAKTIAAGINTPLNTEHNMRIEEYDLGLKDFSSSGKTLAENITDPAHRPVDYHNLLSDSNKKEHAHNNCAAPCAITSGALKSNLQEIAVEPGRLCRKNVINPSDAANVDKILHKSYNSRKGYKRYERVCNSLAARVNKCNYSETNITPNGLPRNDYTPPTPISSIIKEKSRSEAAITRCCSGWSNTWNVPLQCSASMFEIRSRAYSDFDPVSNVTFCEHNKDTCGARYGLVASHINDNACTGHSNPNNVIDSKPSCHGRPNNHVPRIMEFVSDNPTKKIGSVLNTVKGIKRDSNNIHGIYFPHKIPLWESPCTPGPEANSMRFGSMYGTGYAHSLTQMKGVPFTTEPNKGPYENTLGQYATDEMWDYNQDCKKSGIIPISNVHRLKRCSIYSDIYMQLTQGLAGSTVCDVSGVTAQSNGLLEKRPPLTLSQQRYVRDINTYVGLSEEVPSFGEKYILDTPNRGGNITLSGISMQIKALKKKLGANKKRNTQYMYIHHQETPDCIRTPRPYLEGGQPPKEVKMGSTLDKILSMCPIVKVCKKFVGNISPHNSRDELDSPEDSDGRGKNEPHKLATGERKKNNNKPCSQPKELVAEPVVPKLEGKIESLGDVDSLRKLKCANLRLYNENYITLTKVGLSERAKINKVMDRNTKELFVSKTVRVNQSWSIYISRETNRGIPLELVMNKIFSGHPSFLTFRGYYDLVDEYTILTEYMGDKWIDLFTYIDNIGPNDNFQAKYIVNGVLKGIKYMHSIGIAHNDIKDENIIIDVETLNTKIIDFGSASEITNKPCTYFKGTEKYACPQYLTGGVYTDMQQESWAFGCLIFVLCFRVDPFRKNLDPVDTGIVDLINTHLATPKVNRCNFRIDYDLLELTTDLMRYEPTERLQIKDIQPLRISEGGAYNRQLMDYMRAMHAESCANGNTLMVR